MTREYASPVREEQARATRRRILDAARALLLDGGYAQMTVAHLARTAGVSAQTIYNSVGGKAEVIKAVYDVTLAGDDQPLPMSSRLAFSAIAEADTVAAWASAYAGWSRVVMERVGPLLGVLLDHGSGGDPLLEAFVATIDRERRRGNENGLRTLIQAGVLPGGRRRARVIDSIWVLTAPEVWSRLVRRCGWSAAAYETWLADQLRAGVERLIAA